ncbi:tyrosine-type recombinase/integrase [Streptomyces sp. NPDC047804]|uniref:site-specific integrase n=2 Tax=Streptomyces TaxID=1883 RepID=UPI0023B196E4|nr:MULTISPECIES: tyrosine-type recombinase/integrase [unclassified Streptomyces]MDF0371739.1 site-specific integrase [Streptomyces sp. KA12]
MGGMTGKRGNGEGSIYPYKNGYAAYVWVTKPDGKRARKYAYGKTREEVHDKWIRLHAEAKKGPVATSTPTLAAYLERWLKEVVEPDLKPKTAETYAMHVRLYLVPGLGAKRLDKLTVRDVRTWVNRLLEDCQCCVQGKDARRDTPRCCAAGDCCGQVPSRRTVQDARAVLRSALTNAMTEELITKNVAGLVKVRSGRKVKRSPWSVEEARQFLEAAQATRDPLYPAYVLILVLGFRRGEVLGLTWENVDLDAGEVSVQLQLQRIRRRLVHDETKTEASSATLPLPQICVTALQLRRKEQEAAKQAAGELWSDSDFVFTTRYGTPIEPRNFNRSFTDRSEKAGVRRIRLHDTRHTCGSLLAALDVHPRIAMQILRHSKIAVTMEVYTHVPSEATRKALRKLGKHLGRQDPG